ncbi:MAG: hypothetical protein JNJ94_15190 [Chlorobi bacterium]|nr:hypothetical protein [Chlorobiota bacterium]
MATLDLLCDEDRGDRKPVRYYAKRWLWSIGTTFRFLEGWNKVGTRLEHVWNTFGTKNADSESETAPCGTRLEHVWNTFGTVPSEEKNEEYKSSNIIYLNNTILCSTPLNDCEKNCSLEELPDVQPPTVGGDPTCEEERATPLAPPRKKKRGATSGTLSAQDARAEAVYQAYPRKVARKMGLQAIAKALRHESFEVLLAQTQRFAEAVESWPPSQRKFIPHPATWFNQERWHDDPAIWEERGVSVTPEIQEKAASRGLDIQKLVSQEKLDAMLHTDRMAYKRFHIFHHAPSGKKFYLLPSDAPTFMPKEFVLLQPALL